MQMTIGLTGMMKKIGRMIDNNFGFDLAGNKLPF